MKKSNDVGQKVYDELINHVMEVYVAYKEGTIPKAKAQAILWQLVGSIEEILRHLK